MRGMPSPETILLCGECKLKYNLIGNAWEKT